MSLNTISCCSGCAGTCAVCHGPGANHSGARACNKCKSSRNLGTKCPVCGNSRKNGTTAKLCNKCWSKHKANICDFCGGHA